ncbi:hypothetical protein QTP88_009320 [Uroleucon formosanum]
MTSTIGYLYRHIIRDEVVCVQYLKDRGLLLAENPMTCIKVKDGVITYWTIYQCVSRILNHYQKNTLLSCLVIRTMYITFSFPKNQTNLHTGILLISTVQWTERGKLTVVDWFNLCQDVVVDHFSKRQKMGDHNDTTAGCLTHGYRKTVENDRGEDVKK